jgi:hypothetical protein
MTPAAMDDEELRPPSIIAGAQQASPVQTAEEGYAEANTDPAAKDVHHEEEEELPTVPPPPTATPTAQLPPAEPGVRVVAALLRAPTAEARKSQLAMSIGVLVVSVSLGASALGFHDEIFDATGIQSGLLLGSAGSLSMCAVIIGTYLSTKWYRRHMHILLLNLALCEFCLALSFLLEPVWNRLGAGVGSHLSCRWVRENNVLGRVEHDANCLYASLVAFHGSRVSHHVLHRLDDLYRA